MKPEGLPDFTDFSFNPKLFPDPAAQIAAMKSQGVHFVGIRKPRLGRADLLAMARSKGWILRPGNQEKGSTPVAWISATPPSARGTPVN